MSHTIDITLLLGTLDDQVLDEFNQALGEAGVTFDHNVQPLASLSAALGQLPSAKNYTDFIAAACWNNSPDAVETLVDVFQAYPWKSPENAVLIVADEQDETIVSRPAGY